MKSHLFLFLGLLPALTCGCKKEKTEPIDKGINFEFEASETIGPAGGVIETDEFSLTVPAGAFDLETELVLSSATDKQTFGDNLVSGMFKIEGIPVEYSKPLRVKIKFEGSLSEESYIALGEEVFVSSLDSVIHAFQFMDASESSGWLISEIPIPENSQDQSGSKRKSANETDYTGFILGCLTQYVSLYSEEQHFFISYPLLMASYDDVVELGKYLEEAYSFFQTKLGFDYSNRTNWPVRVNVCPFPKSAEALGFYTNSYLGNNFGWIEFNYSTLQNRPDIRITAGHEFFHLVQSLYDNRAASAKAGFPSDFHWFNEATAVWSESFFSDNQNYQSDIVDFLQMSSFNGLHAGARGKEIVHGYGMLALINYLVSIYGDDFIVKGYQSIADGVHVMDAISQHIDNPADWLEDFFRNFVLGNLELYNVNASYIFNNVHGRFLIKDKKNFKEESSDIYNDLSARLFRIDFEDNTIDDNDRISIKVEGVYKDLTEITIFNGTKGVNGRIEYVTNAAGGIIIGNIKSDYIDKNSHMYVLVTNKRATWNYSDLTSYSVTVEMKEETLPPDWTICSARIYVAGQIQKTSSTGTREVDIVRGYGNVYEGSFTDNHTFTGNYSFSDADLTTTGQMVVVLNDSRDTIVSVSFTEESTTDLYQTTTSFVAKNIPKNTSPFSQNSYIISGESVCAGNIVSLDYNRTRKTEEGEDEELLNYSCTAESHIEISYGTDK